MTGLRLVARGLAHHRRAHAATVACVAIATAALTGSLIVGDSVEASLRALERQRLGRVATALRVPGRTVRAALAAEIERDLHAIVAPALELPAVAAREGDDASVPGVRLYGVDGRFFALGLRESRAPGPEQVSLGRALAEALHARPGDEVILRADRPRSIARDLPLAAEDDPVALRLTVDRIVGDDEMGRFSLRADADPPLLAFVALDGLAAQAGVPGRANLLLTSEANEGVAQASLRARLELDDLGATIEPGEAGGLLLRSDRIFVDEPLARAARARGGRGSLTWFVRELRAHDRSTPYSAITAIERRPGTGSDPLLVAIDGLAPDEILVNEWLAEDLGVAAGDPITLRYDAFGDAHRLVAREETLRVRAVIPMSGAAADRRWMPEVPALTDVPDCRDWHPGIPIESERIRPKDEAYWARHRGTPKAFISLDKGEKLWISHYGAITGVRFERTSDGAGLARAIDPAEVGIAFTPAQPAARAAIDFGPLFVGFSVVLVAAALLLTSLLFSFSIDARRGEIGTLAALGFRARAIRGLFAAEAAVLAVAGAIVGAGAGVLYTRAVLAGLSTIWREAVGLPALQMAVRGPTIAIGLVAGTLAAAPGLLLVLRGRLRTPARVLLAGEIEESPAHRARSIEARHVAIAASVIAVVSTIALRRQPTIAFPLAGTLLLASGIAVVAHLLRAADRGARLDLFGLALRGAARRRGRSLTTVGLLAGGTFLVVAVSAARLDPRAGASSRASGTGGFALAGESTRPLARDLDTPAGRAALGVAATLDARVVSLRVHDGDDASCKSPGRAVAPRLLGVDPAALAARGAFSFEAHAPVSPGTSPWLLLDRRGEDGAVPVIGDEGTVVWSLHLGVGDTLDTFDERHRPLRLRIAGITTTSILQGALVLAERELTAAFPGDGGYRLFLVDAAQPEAVATALVEPLADAGLRLQPAWRRLAAFQSVENTYLAVFQALSALGLLLGTIGAAVLVLRHAIERRGERAVLAALGFSRARIRRLAILEHLLLVGMGLAIGVVAAVVALAPGLRVIAPLPLVAGLLLTAGTGAGAVVLAAQATSRREVLDALKAE